MKQKTVDRRVRYTKRQLSEGLIELMSTKPLYKISIKEICDKADINRSTFYSHYETQYELYDEIVRETLADIKSIVDTYPKKRSTVDDMNLFRNVLSYVENNRELFLVLLSDKGNLTVGETLSDLMSELTTVDETESEELAVMRTYTGLFISSGVASILWKWLNTENRLSADKLAMTVYSLISRGTRTAELIKVMSKQENS